MPPVPCNAFKVSVKQFLSITLYNTFKYTTSKTWFYKLPAAKVTQFRGNIAMLNMITSKQFTSFENLSGFFENLKFFWKLEFFENLFF